MNKQFTWWIGALLIGLLLISVGCREVSTPTSSSTKSEPNAADQIQENMIIYCNDTSKTSITGSMLVFRDGYCSADIEYSFKRYRKIGNRYYIKLRDDGYCGSTLIGKELFFDSEFCSLGKDCNIKASGREEVEKLLVTIHERIDGKPGAGPDIPEE